MLNHSSVSRVDSVIDTFVVQKNIITESLILISGALFLTLCSYIYIPLSFTPVPITLQTYAVLTLSTLMGSKRAPLSVGLYLVLSLLGFPVLAEGRAGYEVMFGATGGYLVGFVLAAYVVGLLIEKGWDRSAFKGLLAFSFGQLLIFIPGLLWLGTYVGYESVLEKGLYPFILGGIIKSLLGVTTSLLIWKFVDQLKSKGKV